MASPFPGMDPYFEAGRFTEFHAKFLSTAQDLLNRILPPPYRVDYESQVIIREPSAEERRVGIGTPYEADLAVTRGGGATVLADAPATPITTTHVYQAVVPAVDKEKRRWLEVRRRDDKRIVAHLELLSPSNKRQDRAAYVAKRAALMRSDTHFLEIDLLRGGRRLPMENVPDSAYYALVARAGGWPKSTVWIFGLRDPMPTIPVPLADGDPDVPLDLQAVLHKLYDDASYDRDFDLYAAPPDPPLGEADAAWAAGVLKEAGVTA